MSDTNKTAAAIMAAEAARQQRDLTASVVASKIEGYDIAAEIWGHYEHFLRLLDNRDRQDSASP